MKRILLQFRDEKKFYDLKTSKQQLEKVTKRLIPWESFIMHLLAFKKVKGGIKWEKK